MHKYINSTGISLPMAVVLATDTYDHDPNTISATALIRPMRQIVLSERVPAGSSVTDIAQLAASTDGTASHDFAEKAWRENYKQAMTDLGYQSKIIDLIRIDPTEAELAANPDIIPVHLEQRIAKEVDGYTVSGKYDMIFDGELHDYKKTSVFQYMNDTKAKANALQGSIYRWLAPDKIKGDFVNIEYFLNDWVPGRSYDPKYPKGKTISKAYPLMPIQETEAYVRGRLAEYTRLKSADQSQLPLCTDEELWRSEPTYKYYKNPNKMTRSTKNFTDKAEAYAQLAKDKHVGTIVVAPAEVKACNYCAAQTICTQRESLIADGSLKLKT